VMRFFKGMNSPVRELPLAQVLTGTTYEVLVDMALLHETKAEEKKKEKENVACNRCNKTGHLAKDCRANLRRVDTKGKCFNCLEPGHYSNQCPKLRREGPSAQVNAIEAVPMSTQPSMDTGRAALEGKILILGNVISTLVDSGASHTFISHTIVKSLSMKTENIIDPLVVSNPIGGTSYWNLVCKDLALDISDVEFY